MANKLSSENSAAQSGDGRTITRADNNPPSLVALLVEQLGDTYGLEFAKVDPIRAKANGAEQKIETDEQLAAWTGIYNDASALFKQLDEARKREKNPLTAAVDDTFKAHTDPLARIMEWVKAKADAYNREKMRRQRAEEAAERERLAAIARKAEEEARIAAEFGDSASTLEQVAKVYEAQDQARQVETAKTADVARVRADGGGVSTAATVWKFKIDDYSKVDLNAIRHLIPAAAIDKAVGAIVKLQKGATRIEGVTVYEDVGTSFRR